MGAFNNPLVGASWGNQPQQQQKNPFGMPQGGLDLSQTPYQSNSPAGWNPGGYSNPRGPREINRNVGIENLLAAGYKNKLAGQWAPLMAQFGLGAGNFYNQLMDKGSPFYQQKQTEAFNQNVQQNQNAAALAQQQLAARGYGYTPSGANAAMIGGMAMQGAQNEAEAYLQNLFQNEQLMLAGAQGAQGVGAMFNPTQVLGGTSVGADIQASPSFFQNFGAVTSGLGGLFGGAGKMVGAARQPNTATTAQESSY